MDMFIIALFGLEFKLYGEIALLAVPWGCGRSAGLRLAASLRVCGSAVGLRQVCGAAGLRQCCVTREI